MNTVAIISIICGCFSLAILFHRILEIETRNRAYHFKIRVSLREGLKFKNLHIEDRRVWSTLKNKTSCIADYIWAKNEEEALDIFHESCSIKVLGDFEIEAERF